MQSVKQNLIQGLIRIFSPSSPAYYNSTPFTKEDAFTELIEIMKPGDIIFSRTNSAIYKAARSFMDISYDHVSVVINQKQVIHISPPIICKLPIERLVNKDRQPLVVRPNMDEESRERMLTILHNFLGQKYNLPAIPLMAMRELERKINLFTKIEFSLMNLKYSRVCSDAIAYALCKAHPVLSKTVGNLVKKTRFHDLGYFMPDQLQIFLNSINSQTIYCSETKIEKNNLAYSTLKNEKFRIIAYKISKTMVKVVNFGKNVGQTSVAIFWKAIEGCGEASKIPGLHSLSLIFAIMEMAGIPFKGSMRTFAIGVNLLLVIGQLKQFGLDIFSPKL